MEQKRSYRGVSAQERRDQRRTALLDAALDVVGTQGYASLTVSGLCKTTGLNDRYFTESFESRTAIFSAVLDRMLAEMASALAVALEADTGEKRSRIHAAAKAAIEYLTDDPRRTRIAVVEAPAHPIISKRRREVMDIFLTIAQNWATGLYGEAAVTRSAGRAAFGGVAMFGAMMETIASWQSGDLRISRDELIEHTTDLGVVLIDHMYGTDTPHADVGPHYLSSS